MKERSTGVARSTYYLPLIRSYADAKLRFQKTKPIRGRTEDMAKYGITSTPTPTVPLGRREDVDNYSIRMTEDGSIQLINYRTPLLTFMPDNRIVIAPKYMSIMESGMIERVLGIDAWLDRRKIGITIDDERHVIEAGKTLTLQCTNFGDQDHLSVVDKDAVFSYYVNRKASNNVRSQYSNFTAYLHGFLQLRKDVEDNVIQISLSEIADCVGYEYSEQNIWSAGRKTGEEKVWRPSIDAFKLINDKPQGVRCLWRNFTGTGYSGVRNWDNYQEQTKAFLGLASNDQPEEVRTDNYYRATLTLLALSVGYLSRIPRAGEDRTVAVPVGRVQRLWDEVVLKFYSDEMLDKRPLKPNQLPNEKYNRYVTIMPTQAEIDDMLKREQMAKL